VGDEKDPAEAWTPDRRWTAMLAEYLGRHEIELPENPRVLNIGCGNNVKWNYLGVTGFLLGRGLGLPHYVGLDLREEAFGQAKEVLDGLVHFIAADARQLSRYLEGPFHLIFVEHPNLTTSPEEPKIWRQVFEEAAGLLAQEGALILTSFWLNDHIPAQVALERSGYRLLFSGTNRYPGRSFDTLETGETLETEKYILIARKKRAVEH
jgi:SAM-dependent methyltransferase